MKLKTYLSFFIIFCASGLAVAQKALIEGTISYKIQISTTDNKVFNGTYIFTCKNGYIRKDLKLSNGYEDVVLINTMANTAYSLQTRNGKKYAIQLSIDELNKKQKKFADFELKEDKNTGKIIAGYTVFKGEATYKDGSKTEIYYTPDWCPDKTLTFERFPNAKFMPLSCSYKDEAGYSMHMEADKMSATPVENSMFHLPVDYKIISYAEYKQLSR